MVDKSLTSTIFTQILHPFRSCTQSCAQTYTQKKQPAERQAAKQSRSITYDYRTSFF